MNSEDIFKRANANLERFVREEFKHYCCTVPVRRSWVKELSQEDTKGHNLCAYTISVTHELKPRSSGGGNGIISVKFDSHYTHQRIDLTYTRGLFGEHSSINLASREDVGGPIALFDEPRVPSRFSGPFRLGFSAFCLWKHDYGSGLLEFYARLPRELDEMLWKGLPMGLYQEAEDEQFVEFFGKQPEQRQDKIVRQIMRLPLEERNAKTDTKLDEQFQPLLERVGAQYVEEETNGG